MMVPKILFIHNNYEEANSKAYSDAWFVAYVEVFRFFFMFYSRTEFLFDKYSIFWRVHLVFNSILMAWFC